MFNKIWNYLSMLFLGIIAGIVIFIKFLDEPEVQNEITVKKIKNKNSNSNDTNFDMLIDSTNENNKQKTKLKNRFKNVFKRNKSKSNE